MPERDGQPDLSDFSNQLADAVQRAAEWTLHVQARRGHGASAIAIGADLAITADHAIESGWEGSIRVGLPDGGEVAASLVGRDPATDLAVLRVTGASLTTAEPSDGLPRVGALALAVARPEREPAASLALVSGIGGPARTRRGGMLERFIQVDAVLYPGFSGGPLVDSQGRVLGLTTSGLAVFGFGVAIPWEIARGLAETIATHGKVPRGYLGVGSQPVSLSGAAREQAGVERGLLVLHITENGPAARAGFLQGDILVRMDSQPIASADELQALLGPQRVGATLRAAVVRGGELKELDVTVGSRE